MPDAERGAPAGAQRGLSLLGVGGLPRPPQLLSAKQALSAIFASFGKSENPLRISLG